jgi:hypothetical protein
MAPDQAEGTSLGDFYFTSLFRYVFDNHFRQNRKMLIKKNKNERGSTLSWFGITKPSVIESYDLIIFVIQMLI